jgi:hypothetical protein
MLNVINHIREQMTAEEVLEKKKKEKAMADGRHGDRPYQT